MSKTALSRELTEQYQNQTLPDGYYYFSIADLAPQIGKYVKPKKEYCIYCAQTCLTIPLPALNACPGMFLGTLKTITILAPVPAYQEA